MTFEDYEHELLLAEEHCKRGRLDEGEAASHAILSALDGMVNDDMSMADKVKEFRARALLILGDACYRRADSQQAISITQQALALALDIEHLILIGKAYNILGNVYYYLCDYRLALENYRQSLAIQEKRGHQYFIAIVVGNMASVYLSLGDYSNAIEYRQREHAIFDEHGDRAQVAHSIGNMGVIYVEIGDYERALEYYFRALAMQEELENKIWIAQLTGNIGIVYQEIGEYSQALEYYLQSLALYREFGERQGIARLLGSIGGIYTLRQEYATALEYFEESKALHTQLGSMAPLATNIGNIGSIYTSLGEYDRALEYLEQSLKINEEIGAKLGAARLMISIATVYTKEEFQDKNTAKAEKILHRAIALCEELNAKQLLYKGHHLLASVYERAERWKEQSYHFKQYHDIEKEVQNEDAKKLSDRLAYERREAEREKSLAVTRARAQATDEILGNILPHTITERLIKGEKRIADIHESVSVLFVDIVGFTTLSMKLSAGELIDLLDTVFTRFDMICKKHGLEKIKTIGDAYMAVCGAPVASEHHAYHTACAALEMLEKTELDDQYPLPDNFGFRIGLHTGSVVAGIIGENKFAYDLWGDAVNTASRMESHGEPGKIHVSEEFKHAVETHNIASLQFIERGEIDIKGKGKMKTYFLEKSH